MVATTARTATAGQTYKPNPRRILYVSGVVLNFAGASAIAYYHTMKYIAFPTQLGEPAIVPTDYWPRWQSAGIGALLLLMFVCVWLACSRNPYFIRKGEVTATRYPARCDATEKYVYVTIEDRKGHRGERTMSERRYARCTWQDPQDGKTYIDLSRKAA